MEFRMILLGGELFGSKFERAKKEVKPSEVFNNCVFDNRQPIIHPPVENSGQDLITKNVKKEDYAAICEIISERSGVPPEKVDEVLKISGEYIKNL